MLQVLFKANDFFWPIKKTTFYLFTGACEPDTGNCLPVSDCPPGSYDCSHFYCPVSGEMCCCPFSQG